MDLSIAANIPKKGLTTEEPNHRRKLAPEKPQREWRQSQINDTNYSSAIPRSGRPNSSQKITF
jgi:hypothetical protein